jgi:hypothetical protein
MMILHVVDSGRIHVKSMYCFRYTDRRFRVVCCSIAHNKEDESAGRCHTGDSVTRHAGQRATAHFPTMHGARRLA